VIVGLLILIAVVVWLAGLIGYEPPMRWPLPWTRRL